MKLSNLRFSFVRAVAGTVLALLAGVSAYAFDHDTTVHVSIGGTAYKVSDPDQNSWALQVGIDEFGPYNYYGGDANQTKIQFGPIDYALVPGVTYHISAWETWVDSTVMNIVAPPNYTVEVDGMDQSTIVMGGNDGAHLLRIVPARDLFKGRAGTSSSIANGKLYWQVSLGSLKNGDSARCLAIVDAATEPNWNTIFTPAALIAQRESTEIVPIWQNSVLRQVKAHEAFADIVTVSSTAYDIKFYSRSSGGATGGNELANIPYTFTGNPFVVYRVEQGDTATTLKITRTDYDSSGAALSPQYVTSLKRTGTSPNFSWRLEDWHETTKAAVVIETSDWSQITLAQAGLNADTTPTLPGSTAIRQESIVRLDSANAVSSRILKGYASVYGSEQLIYTIRGTAQSGSNSKPVQECFDYNSDGYVYQKKTSGGYSEIYTYAAGIGPRAGRITNRSVPYGDTDQAEQISSTYQNGPRLYQRIRGTETKVNTYTTAKSTITYSDVGDHIAYNGVYYNDTVRALDDTTLTKVNGNVVVTSTRTDVVDNNTTTKPQTVTKFYREDIEDRFFARQTHSVTNPDGTKISSAYQYGTLDGSKVGTTSQLTAFTPSSGGGDVRIVTIHGVASGGSTQLTTFDGYTLDPIYVVNGKSTMDVIVRDGSALLKMTETRAWISGAWVIIGWTYYDYDYANRLIKKTTNKGVVYEADYSGERKNYEIDETGVKLSYTYDAAGRIDSVTKAGIADPQLNDLVTKYTYDADNHTLTVKVVGNTTLGDLLTTSTYDDTGRLASETAPGIDATTYTYDPVARTKTTTFPDTGTKIETKYKDGKLKSVTGTAVVAESYTYSVLSSGWRYKKITQGSGTARYSEEWTDCLDHVVKTSHPGFTGQQAVVETFNYDAATGRLTSQGRTGYATTYYQYNVMSELTQAGTDISGLNGALANGVVDLGSRDRITETDSSFEAYDNAYWLKKTTKTYPYDDNATALTTSIVRERVTGFSGTLREEVRSTEVDAANAVNGDVLANQTVRTVDVDRTAKLVQVTTSIPAYANDSVEQTRDGLLMSKKGFDGLEFKYKYDVLWRLSAINDPRTGDSTKTYKIGSAFVQEEKDAAGYRLSYTDYDTSGRPSVVTDAQSHHSRYAYNKRGQVEYQWGNAAYPVQYVYNDLGEKTEMHTFRDPAHAINWDASTWPGSSATYDKTAWDYDAPSGLLTTKTDNVGKATTFTYNLRGQTETRTSARHTNESDANSALIKVTYAYFDLTGELKSISYNDGATTSVSYDSATPAAVTSYSRTGQVRTVNDATGRRTFTYDSSKPWRLNSEQLPSYFESRVLSRTFEESNSTNTGDTSYSGHTITAELGRSSGFKLATSGNATELQVTYAIDDLGRFAGETSSSAPRNDTFVYGYETSSSLVKTLSVVNNGFFVTRSFETQRDLLQKIDTQWSGGVSRLRYDYTNNSLAQRDTSKQSGDAFDTEFGSATSQKYTYNSRGELEDATGYLGDIVTNANAPQMTGRHHAFTYDTFGNRLSASRTGAAGAADIFTPNSLNQYASRENHVAHIAGTVATDSVAVSVTGGSLVSAVGRQGRYWDAQMMLPNQNGPAKAIATVSATLAGTGGAPDTVRTDTRTAYLPPSLQSFSYDADGNLTGDGLWTYVWDPENRLTRMTTTSAAANAGFPNVEISFAYDYLDRRVEKRVRDLNSNSDISRSRFVYDGWNPIAEYATSPSLALTLSKSYTWALDLTGSLTASGGVGALVRITDHSSSISYFPAYDGNGNVGALIQAADGASRSAGSVVAKYEYSPFGELLRCEGVMAKANPFRFSTKFTDDEAGLVYYGYRYYSPSLGRFINRDPIGETGGLNLYGFVANDPIRHWDRLGHTMDDDDDEELDGSPGFDDMLREDEEDIQDQQQEIKENSSQRTEHIAANAKESKGGDTTREENSAVKESEQPQKSKPDSIAPNNAKSTTRDEIVKLPTMTVVETRKHEEKPSGGGLLSKAGSFIKGFVKGAVVGAVVGVVTRVAVVAAAAALGVATAPVAAVVAAAGLVYTGVQLYRHGLPKDAEGWGELVGGFVGAGRGYKMGGKYDPAAFKAGLKVRRTFSPPEEPYNRRAHYGNTPTKADRRALGAGTGEVVDHEPSLVKRYWEGDPSRLEKPGYEMTPAEREASANDRSRMRIQPRPDSNRQGAEMARYSREMNEQYGLDD